MTTRFMRWLQRQKLSPWGFAAARGYGYKGVHRLAGIAKPGERVQRWREDFLMLISGETGIPVEVLKAEAERAMKNPLPPRPYRRRTQEDQDGKTAE